MAEDVMTPITRNEGGRVAPYVSKTGRFALDGFSGWQKNVLTVLIAMQILFEKLLLVDAAISVRKKVERYRAKF